MNIANQGFPATRADLNNALQALATNSSGTSAPSTTFANQWWYDTTNNKLYIRNEANNAWIQVAVLDQTNNEWQITTGQISASDGDGLVFKTDDGTTRVTLSDGGDVTFADGTDVITASAGTDNVRIGQGAGDSIASGGDDNVAIGKDAGTAITTGEKNIAIGSNALDAETVGSRSVAIGHQALTTQNFTSANNVYNVAIGFDAGNSITTGKNNTIIGGVAGDALSTGGNNVAVGTSALGAATTSSDNTAIGNSAGANITTGDRNVIVGRQAGDALTEGARNVSIGYHSLSTDILGSKSVAVGYQSLRLQNPASAADMQNTAVGYNAGASLTTGQFNTFIGSEVGDANTTASGNSALGYAALSGTTTGEFNTAIGREAMEANTEGSNNTALGFRALEADTKGSHNVAVGRQALKVQNFTSATDGHNTAVGNNAGMAVTTGRGNTLIGSNAGNGLTDGNDNVLIGYDVDHSSVGGSNAIVIGQGITAPNNDFAFGKPSNVVSNDFDADANWSRSSDERLKKNITDQKLGLAFINDLRTVKYNWKPNDELDASDAQLAHLRREDDDGNIINDMNTEATMHNFIAQEVKAALDTAGVSDFSGWSEDEHGVQQVSREMFVIPLVKAVQELSAKVDALETENTNIKARLDALEAG